MSAITLAAISISNRRKFASVLLAVAIFAFLGGLTTLALHRPIAYGITNAILIGLSVGLFEEFYVQGLRGRWLRAMHPLRSILVYTAVVVVIYVIAMHLTHLTWGQMNDLPVVYRRLPIAITLFVVLSVIGIVVMRVVDHLGAGTLFHLMVGTYHRPVLRRMILLFVDINGSTALAQRLGAFETRAMVGKFIFDISRPITDHGGDIYLYKGDGLIALWDWNGALKASKLLRAVDAMFTAVERERPEYERLFGLAPSFRIGIHGGDVVVSEQGDTKRGIGVYGDTINIAARMEEAASSHGVPCVISGDVATALGGTGVRLLPLGDEEVKGVATPIPICEYRPAALARPSARTVALKEGAATAP
jgi:class 3 adenylate cyclase